MVHSACMIYLGLVHILIHNTFKSEARTVIRCLVLHFSLPLPNWKYKEKGKGAGWGEQLVSPAHPIGVPFTIIHI